MLLKIRDYVCELAYISAWLAFAVLCQRQFGHPMRHCTRESADHPCIGIAQYRIGELEVWSFSNTRTGGISSDNDTVPE